MSKDNNAESSSNQTFNELMGKTTEFWSAMTKTWIENAGSFSKASDNSDGSGFPSMNWETLVSAWKSGGEIFDQKNIESFFYGVNSVSDNFSKLMKSNWTSIRNTQDQFMKSSESLKDSFSKYKIDGPGSEAFDLFQDIYQKEISKFFSVPQLGLTRFYQEKMMNLIDKFNLFQVNMFEFMYVLYMPFHEVFKTMNSMFSQDKEKLPKDFNDYYRVWIKMLEEKYMDLFRSTEYIHVLGNALQSLNDFLAARQSIIQDVLKMAGIPGEKDLDELYKDIYTLKKRVATLEKEQKNNQAKSS